MARFDPGWSGARSAVRSRPGMMFVVGAALAALVGLGLYVSGGDAHSTSTDPTPKSGGGGGANAEFGVANVFVSRGGEPARFATFSATLGSPAGTTTGGAFRFSCSQAQAPCKVSLGAAVISERSGEAILYPRLLIHKQNGDSVPITFCEYADGANNNLGIDRIRRVPTLGDAIVAMQEPLDMGIGGSLDCGSTQPYPPNGTVREIWVPAASNGTETAFYDVSATLTFR
jgi:hypothetical protein